MEFEMKERQGLLIWLYSTKDHKLLRQHGYVYYISERMRYALMYVDKEIAELTAKELKKYHFVRDIEFSKRDDIDMTFKDAIPDPVDPDFRHSSEDENEDEDDFFKEIAELIRQERQEKYQSGGY